MKEKERYLVYGASGVQGGAVAQLLIMNEQQVRTVTRSNETAITLRNQGIDAFIGDFSDNESLDKAHQGIDKVFLNVPVDFDLRKVRRNFRNAVDAAQRANVKLLVVNTSVFVYEQPTDCLAIEIKRELISYVKESGVPYIIVQPIVYMENLLIPGVLNDGVLAYPVPSNKPIAWISAEDAAKYHFYALTHAELEGNTLQAPGPEALTGAQLSERISNILNQKIEFVSLPFEGFEAAISPMLGKETALGLSGLYRWLSQNTELLPDFSEANPKIISSFQWTTLSEWLEKVLKKQQ
ncbi:NmrA family NAD(P)-binding protein [Paenibacillus sp. FSL R5-0519]|uniref:NmrA family NAD(P)-binding protein n=1 Tax=Paenibacillus sp. FSL R5-0519 TaxID=2921648 RepID=UPI0030DB6401